MVEEHSGERGWLRECICRALQCTTLALCTAAAPAQAADVILNEYNGVGSTRYLDADDYTDASEPVDRADPYFASLPALEGDGRVQGNGGNWFELVVVGDYVDMRGWQLQWVEADKYENDGSMIWFTPAGGPAPNQGVITLNDTPAWSDLRAGTIITFSELAQFQVDTTPVGANKNFNDFADPIASDGEYEVVVDLATDLSFDPAAGDWWMHISTRGEIGQTAPLTTTVANTLDALGVADPAGSFSTGNDNWSLTIVDADQNVLFGPAGEDIWGVGVNSREVAKLEADPTGDVTADDEGYNDGSSSTFGLPNEWSSGEMSQDFSLLRSWFAGQPNADFNEDGAVDGADFVAWQRGYGAGPDATPAQGDADGNGTIDHGDLSIWESSFGSAEGATKMLAIPEPVAVQLALVTWLAVVLGTRRPASMCSSVKFNS